MDKVIKLIKSNYDLSLRLVKRIDGGYLSNNYVFTNREYNFFLKGYCYEDINRVEEIQKIEFFFAAGGIPIILPIQNKHGLYIFTVSGVHYSLFPYVEGRIISYNDLTAKALASAGKMLARLHSLTKNGIPNFVTEVISPCSKDIFLEEVQLIKEKLRNKNKLDNFDQFDQLVKKSINFKKEAVEKNQIEYEDLNLPNSHLIHGDYYNANLFFDEDDNIKYVFDLEKAKRAPRIYDVIRAIDSMCFFAHFEDKNFKKAKIFIQAYNSEFPLDEIELEKGVKYYYFRKIHSLLVEKEHYLKGNIRLDDFLKSDLVAFRYYASHLEDFIKRLSQFLIT